MRARTPKEALVKILLALATVLAFAGCQTPSNEPSTPTTSDGTDGVSLRIATPERVAGSYVDATGQGIEFDTARTEDSLYMHVATKSGRVLIHAETTASSYVFHYMDNRLTLEVSKAWVTAVRAEGDNGP